MSKKNLVYIFSKLIVCVLLFCASMNDLIVRSRILDWVLITMIIVINATLI